jgi:hypothetical protein
LRQEWVEQSYNREREKRRKSQHNRLEFCPCQIFGPTHGTPKRYHRAYEEDAQRADHNMRVTEDVSARRQQRHVADVGVST